MCVYTHMTAAHAAVISPLWVILSYPQGERNTATLPLMHVFDRSCNFYILHKGFCIFILDISGDGVNDDDFSVQLLGILGRCASAAALHSVENCQQQSRRFHQPVVPVNHTAVIVLAAHILNGISLLQNRMIPFPR